MKKNLILSAIAVLCLLGTNKVSSATTNAKKLTARHEKKAKLFFNQATGMYYNSNSFPVTVLFLHSGFPAAVLNIPAGYTSGTYSVPEGTYDVQFSGSSSATYLVDGHGEQTGTTVTFTGVTFVSGQAVTLTCDL